MRIGARSPLPWLGALLALYLLAPIAAFLVRLSRGVPVAGGVGSALVTSLVTASISTAIIALLGIPLAYVLARARGAAGRAALALVALPLALPALSSGLLLLYLVGPYTTLGRLFGGRLTETRAGIVLAQTFVAAPFLIVAARAAFRSVDPGIADMAAALGHGPLSRFARAAVPAAAPGILAGLTLAWLRAFGEFGATVILAYHPYSLPVYTFVQFDATGLPGTTLPVAAALAAVALIAVLSAARPPRRRRRPPATSPPAPLAQTAATLDFALAARLGTFDLSVGHAACSPQLAVLGPSGAGKTATLRLLAGLARADPDGHVRADGAELSALAPEHRSIAYVPQSPALLPRADVWRQVNFGRNADPALAALWIDRLGLAGLEDRFPEELSGGQQRRVAIARALAVAPRVLLLDEPFAGLDAPVRARLTRELRALQREFALSTVLVTHDAADAALLAREVIVLDAGRVLQAGRTEAVLDEPAGEDVAALLGVANVRGATVTGAGEITCEGLALATSGPLPAAGERVLWCVRPERVVPGPDGAHEALLLDHAEIAGVHELAIALGGRIELLVRVLEPPEVRCGGALRVDLPAEHVRVWRAPARSAADV